MELCYDFHLLEGERSFEECIDSGRLVDIPNCPVKMSENAFASTAYQSIFTYAKKFDFAIDKEKEVAELIFDGAMVKIHVFLNGIDLGTKISSYVKAVFDVTDIVKEKDNELLVVLDSREDPHIPPFGKALDYMTFAGIYRPVHIERRAKIRIGNLHVFPKADGSIKIRKEIIDKEEEGYEVTYIISKDGKEIASFCEDEYKIEEIDKWDIDNPVLYDFKCEIKSRYGIDSKSFRIGFRDAIFKEDGFYLNGVKKKVIGVNRHQSYPYCGCAMPAQAQYDDAKILKDFGMQIIRTSHYPQSEAFLSACDALGLLVIDEIPGWQYTGKDEEWRKNFLFFVREMVEKEMDHPSLVLYGVRIDEGPDDDELYKEANRIAHEIDPSRQTTGVRNFKNSHLLEDVYAYNDFAGGLRAKKKIKSAKKSPYLVSEYCGHVFPTKIYDNQEKRLEHCYKHLDVLDDFYKHDSIAASIGWCAFDYNTHEDFGSGDEVCYHGLFDINRNPKPAAYAYKMQTSKEDFLYVARPLVPGDCDDALIKRVVIFTTCDYIKFYRGDSYIDTFYPDTKRYPHLRKAPIVIDNLMGEMLLEEGLTKKDAIKIGKCLSLCGDQGFGIKKTKLIKFVPALLKNLLIGRLTIKKIMDIFFKYMLVWGEKSSNYRIDGYKDGKKIIERHMSSPSKFILDIDCSKRELINSETYDASRISLRYHDEFDQDTPYISRALSISTEGPIEVIGPSIRPFKGGYQTVYVRSLKVEGKQTAKVHLTTEEGTRTIEFEVS